MFTCISRNVLFLCFRKTRVIWRPEPNFEGHRQSSLKCVKLGLFRTGIYGIHIFYCYICWYVLFIYLFDDVVSNSAKAESKYLIGEDVEVTA